MSKNYLPLPGTKDYKKICTALIKSGFRDIEHAYSCLDSLEFLKLLMSPFNDLALSDGIPLENKGDIEKNNTISESQVVKVREAIIDFIGEFKSVHDPDAALNDFLRLLKLNFFSSVNNKTKKFLSSQHFPQWLHHRSPKPGQKYGNKYNYRELMLMLLGSASLWGDFLSAHPEIFIGFPEILDQNFTWDVASQELYGLRFQDFQDDQGVEPVDHLRQNYRQEIMRIVLEDLTAYDPLEKLPYISRQLTAAADTAIASALSIAQTWYKERESSTGSDTTPNDVDMAIIAFGKTGAQELNYISDVDVMFVVNNSQDIDAATTIARQTMSVLGGLQGKELPLWEVDPNLRPEGKSGVLVRTVDSYKHYYQQWAQSWELQALMKTRAVAGSKDLGVAFEKVAYDIVWTRRADPGFVERVQQMRQRVIDHLDGEDKKFNIKLASGGLRDIEFPIQLLQLVHGADTPDIQTAHTLEAIAALGKNAYISHEDTEFYDGYYRFLRLLEHRVQLQSMRRTHRLPTSERQLEQLAASMKKALKIFRTSPAGKNRTSFGAEPNQRVGYSYESPDPIVKLISTWSQVKRHVENAREEIFYRPLLLAAVALTDEEIGFGFEAAQSQLTSLGYKDPQGAFRHIQALTQGVSRSALIQKQILPALLMWFSEGPNPDAAILGFRRLSESHGKTPWFLNMLRDSLNAGRSLATILSSSPFLTDLLEHSETAVSFVAKGRKFFDLSALSVEIGYKMSPAQAKDATPETINKAVYDIRAIAHRERVFLMISDVTAVGTFEDVSEKLAIIDQLSINALLTIAIKEEEQHDKILIEPSVIGMGSSGGQEQGYGSDQDLVFVYHPLAFPGEGSRAPETSETIDFVDVNSNEGVSEQDRHEQAVRIFRRLRNFIMDLPIKPILAEQGLTVDLKLRPEGNSGALVRSVESYKNYYDRWAQTWEKQALFKARVLGGNKSEELTELLDSIRYENNFLPEQVREIQKMKIRIESERMPSGIDSKRHIKLGPGGLSDIDWLVQFFQVKYAKDFPELQSSNTSVAIKALSDYDIISHEEAEVLAESWRFNYLIRNANYLIGQQKDQVFPNSQSALEALAYIVGNQSASRSTFEEQKSKGEGIPLSGEEIEYWNYEVFSGSVLEEKYMKIRRQTRQIFEKYFYEEQS